MMFDLSAPQVLYSLVSLEVADLLAGGPTNVEDLAERSGAHAPSLQRLLRAAVKFDLVTMNGRFFSLTTAGELLCGGVSGSVRNTVLWYGGEFWPAWGALSTCVRTGKDAFRSLFGHNLFQWLTEHPEKAAIFNEMLAEFSRDVAPTVSGIPGIATGTRIADVGGGSGALLAGVLAANPHLHGLLYDTNSGLCNADATLRAAGVRDRCEIVAGDFFASVPGGCDVYLLKQIIHDWDDERATTILRRCREAMAPGATLYIIDPVVPDDLADASTRTLIQDLGMLVHTSGKERTEAEFAQLLAAVGLKLESVAALPPPAEYYGLVCATPA